MKSIIMAAALCLCSLLSMAQLPVAKMEIEVQVIPKYKFFTVEGCKAIAPPIKPEYKEFVDWLKRPTQGGFNGGNNINFHIKYTTVRTLDSALRHLEYIPDVIPSLESDFVAAKLKCNIISVDKVPFTIFNLQSQLYNVSLDVTLGWLKLVNTETNKTIQISLTPIGYGIYTGFDKKVVNNIEVKETVVLILTRDFLTF